MTTSPAISTTPIRAFYRPSDDRLFIDFGGKRLPEEEFAELRHHWQWWPGRKLFSAVWTPEREDFVRGLGLEVDLATADDEDDAEARAERYGGYAANAAQRSDEAYSRARAIGSLIPFGQPILVGHHSERRHRADAERINSSMRKSVDEDKKADYWAGRAEGARQHAAKKEDPGAIQRKIKKLEAAMRKSQRDRAFIQKNTADETRRENGLRWADRWIEHYQQQVSYYRGLLQDAGGPPPERDFPVRVGDLVRWINGHHYVVLKVNDKTVRLKGGTGPMTVEKTLVDLIIRPELAEKLKASGNLVESTDGRGWRLVSNEELGK